MSTWAYISGKRLAQRQRRRLAFSAQFGHLFPMPMSVPPGAVSASMPRDVRLQIVTPCKTPLVGDGWLQ